MNRKLEFDSPTSPAVLASQSSVSLTVRAAGILVPGDATRRHSQPKCGIVARDPSFASVEKIRTGVAMGAGFFFSAIIFFFFQAEDGIRDLTVTGVQTCALPI